jgi:23S rRNA (guanosine2251-2'-O)-methyltransferase
MTSEELIFGLHAVGALLKQSPERIKQLYILHGREDRRLQEITQEAKKQNIKIQVLSRAELDNLVSESPHQGIIARCVKALSYTEHELDTLLDALSEPPFLLILDEVQDPHNLGACLRSANAAGVHVVIAPSDHSVGLTPAVRKVASGAAEFTPFIQVTNLARTLRKLKERGIWLYGTAMEDATSSLYETNLCGAVGLVLGAEGKGLRRLTRELCDYLVTIPMYGSVSSLNVSVATGICLFEALRQRNKKKS